MRLPAGASFGVLRRMDMTERVGILAAVSGVGQSFGRGLLPRSTADQAIITGVSLTINYAMTALAQSVTESVADAVIGRGARSRRQRVAHRGVLLVGDLAAAGAGLGLQRTCEQRPNEHIGRAIARTLGWRLAVSGTAGSAIVVTDGALDALGGNGKRPWLDQVPVSVPLGGVLAAVSYHQQRRSMVEQGVEHDAEGVSLDEAQAISVGRALALGTGVAGGLLVLAEGERLLADGVAAIVRRVSPSAEILAKPIGHLAGMALFAAACNEGVRRVYHQAEQGGAAVEAAYNEPPTSTCVSGGNNSEVSWSDIGREGRRFVNMALTPTEITDVMGKSAMDPIRVFVGLDSADTTSGRADLAMRELERLGGFDRKLIVFCSPTGTGYLNYVTAESLEYLTGGNVATVAMQYSIRPSPQSLGRVKIAIEQNGAFLQALKWRLSAIPQSRRPRLVIFGESLGAQTSQDVFKDEGVAGLHRATIERGLFLGTPAATKWRQRWLADPDTFDPDGEVIEVDSYEEYLALSDEVRNRARYVLLTHHNDPMPKFWFPIAVQSPRWLSRENRERGVPPEVHWRPYTTFLITLIDVKNAMHVIPGQFVAEGHDYRKDLARFTSVAFNLPVSRAKLEKMELALRRRELEWAERRLLDGQLAGADSKVHDQLRSWGVPEDKIPTVIGSALPQGVDPYQATAPA